MRRINSVYKVMLTLCQRKNYILVSVSWFVHGVSQKMKQMVGMPMKDDRGKSIGNTRWSQSEEQRLLP